MWLAGQLAFAVSSPDLELQVTGAAGDTVEWLCKVTVLQT